MKLHVNILPKNHLGRWSVGLAATFITVLSVSTVIYLWLGALAPNLAGSIALKVEIAALIVSGIGAFTAGLIGIIKRRERSILVFLAVIVSLIGMVLLGAVAWGNPEEVSEEEIISLILPQGEMEGRYDVFNPEMSLPSWLDSEYEDFLRRSFRQEGFNFDELVTALFANNTKPVRMNIPSSPEKGYLIDYDGKFQSYFEQDGGGWVQLRQENPEARTMVKLSVPVYDPKTGFVMIYLGWEGGGGLLGEGRVVVFKYAFGRMIAITSLLLWHS